MTKKIIAMLTIAVFLVSCSNSTSESIPESVSELIESGSTFKFNTVEASFAYISIKSYVRMIGYRDIEEYNKRYHMELPDSLQVKRDLKSVYKYDEQNKLPKLNKLSEKYAENVELLRGAINLQIIEILGREL